jgi:hypothetical protein
MTEKISQIDLFPFFRAFFADDSEWELIEDSAKMKHAFMLNRYLSIKHPENIQCLNTHHSIHIINGLHDQFKSKGKSPGWMYQKRKASSTNSSISWEIWLKQWPTELIKNMLSSHNIELQSLRFYFEIAEAELTTELTKELKSYDQTYSKRKA